MSGLETGEFRVARMPDNPPGIHRMMERLLTARFAATALLVTQPEAYLTVFSSLAARRLRVPEDISLIDCAHDAFLDHLLPQPTGYHIAPSVFASHVLRLVMDVIEGRPLEVPRRLILPEFVRGGSVGRVE